MNLRRDARTISSPLYAGKVDAATHVVFSGGATMFEATDGAGSFHDGDPGARGASNGEYDGTGLSTCLQEALLDGPCRQLAS